MPRVPALYVAIVDDDASVRKALARLLRAFAINPQTFGSAREFLDSLPSGVPECLVLDLHMPDMTGLELQSELLARNDRIPIIFMSAHGDDSARAQGLNAGAVAFLGKPWETQELLDAVQLALEMN